MREKSLAIIVVGLVAVANAAIPGREKSGPSSDLESWYTPMDGSANAPKVKYHCSPVSCCGWFIYNRWTRVKEWFLPNPECECAPDEECARREYNFSTSAYVHYCIRKIPAKTTNSTT